MQLINLQESPVRHVLRELLQDKTTKQNIMFATNAYSDSGITARTPITVELLLGMDSLALQPRVLKSLEEQSQRTRNKAEVFTPSWICNKMNNNCDNVWFRELFLMASPNLSFSSSPSSLTMSKVSTIRSRKRWIARYMTGGDSEL